LVHNMVFLGQQKTLKTFDLQGFGTFWYCFL
jgi:hypothetical protein